MQRAATPSWRYGLLGLPLAFVSLPLYVTLPHHYAQNYGVSLAALGAVLLATRLLDAVVDPLIGRWIDRSFTRGSLLVWRLAAGAALVMALGFSALWQPWTHSHRATLVWLAAALMLTYLSFSVVSVVHQVWGARWGGTPDQRARIVAWREGLALLGVLLASVLPLGLSMSGMSWVLGLTLVVSLVTLRQTRGTHIQTLVREFAPSAAGPSPWANPAFRALLGVFMLNGIASAVPATLLPFFVADRLQAPNWEAAFLGAYFVSAAAALPLWVKLVRRMGLIRAWLCGMLMSILTFVCVPFLGAGDAWAFLVVCVASGLALGADLALPSALLAGVVRHAGQAELGEGRFFGWWTCATKLNLAAAAGLALPLLALLGYSSGTRDPHALMTLGWAYGALPCVLKLIAAWALWRAQQRHPALGSGAS